MNDESASEAVSREAWERPVRAVHAAGADDFVVDVAGYEGPLDLLLAMARTQQVDLASLSVLALAEQYLAFIAEAKRLRLELAADYLVMAAWLTYLKSRLLLPRDDGDDDEPSGEELAQRLAFRLMRLEAMREASARLLTRDRLGRDVFARGQPEAVKAHRDTDIKADLFDLLRAYATLRKRTLPRVHVVSRRRVWSIKDARIRLERLVGRVSGSWLQLDACLKEFLGAGEDSRTIVASSFGAALEMAREGLVDLRQDKPFGPIFMRRREAGALWQRVRT